MILLDTSLLIDALTGPRASLPALRAAVAAGERLTTCTLVMYEWLRGPREAAEITALERVCPRQAVVDFGEPHARLAAELYRQVARGRGRELDLAIAACAIQSEALFWTLNPRDFRDVPGLALYRPA